MSAHDRNTVKRPTSGFCGRRKKTCRICNHETFFVNCELSIYYCVRTHGLLTKAREGRIFACAFSDWFLRTRKRTKHTVFHVRSLLPQLSPRTKQLIKDKFVCPVLWRSPYFRPTQALRAANVWLPGNEMWFSRFDIGDEERHASKETII